ncbi:MAG TPA: hypothetical protein PKY77_25145 [Phycisphaerae bacterium]|nr:hypothetical protein [Phycisphaerae bacterium]HRY69434.1 hypothetical protein [Phycisphaerae bacterium]HSA26301.1 hypothetical protein [Phycisphaerae bacterium]
MFGIDDPFVWLAYVLSITSVILCLIYGLFTWNKSDDPVSVEDRHWETREKKTEEET